MIKSNEWQEFRVGDIFPKIRINKFSNKPVSCGDIPFISSTSSNNGVSLFSDEVSFEGKCISVSTNGNCFDCFYHEGKMSISTDVEILTCDHLNEYNGLFVCSVLNKESFKWSYGRKPKNDKVFDTIIKLPTKEGKPDWDYMESFIKEIQNTKTGTIKLNETLLTNNKTVGNPFTLKPINEWRLFKVSQVFKPFINGIGLTEQEIIDNPGDLAAVQSSSDNNACMGFISETYCREKRYKIVKEPCLTVARSGSAGFVSFQENGCVIGDSAKALVLQYSKANKYHYLFMRTILMANYYKFAYGRKVRVEQYENMEILLPCENGNVDWNFIEEYIKKIPFSDKV